MCRGRTHRHHPKPQSHRSLLIPVNPVHSTPVFYSMPVRKLIVQHGPRSTTLAVPSLYQRSLRSYFEDKGVALMMRKGSPGSPYCSLKACCTARVAGDLFADWAETVGNDFPEIADEPISTPKIESIPARRYYYISASNEAEGPLEVIGIHELVQQQIITEDTLVVAEGDNDWIPFRQVPELAFNTKTRMAARERDNATLSMDETGAFNKIATHESERIPLPFSKVITEFAKTSTLAKKSIWQRFQR